MGIYAYEFQWEWPDHLSDQEEEDLESALASAGLDLFDHWAFAYERSTSSPRYNITEALDAAVKSGREIAKRHPDLKLEIVLARSCGCCPTEIYEHLDLNGVPLRQERQMPDYLL